MDGRTARGALLARFSGRARAAAAVLWLLLAAVAGAASAPSGDREVPVFKGAVRDGAAEAASRAAAGAGPLLGLRPLKSSSLRIYRSDAPAEEIAAFYRDVLGAREDSDPGDPGSLEPGRASAVRCVFGLRDAGDSGDAGDPARAAYEKDGRRPFRDGFYLEDATFTWGARAADGDATLFLLTVKDDSLREEEDPRTGEIRTRYKRRSRIEIRRDTYPAGNADAWERKAEGDHGVYMARLEALTGKPVTEKELGVPLYPHATLEPTASAGATVEEGATTWIFLSRDPADKVAAFYGKATKKKGTAQEGGRRLFVLRGKPPAPAHGVTVGPNDRYDPEYATMIKVRRERDR